LKSSKLKEWKICNRSRNWKVRSPDIPAIASRDLGTFWVVEQLSQRGGNRQNIYGCSGRLGLHEPERLLLTEGFSTLRDCRHSCQSSNMCVWGVRVVRTAQCRSAFLLTSLITTARTQPRAGLSGWNRGGFLLGGADTAAFTNTTELRPQAISRPPTWEHIFLMSFRISF